jgi:predicted dehydrogenase
LALLRDTCTAVKEKQNMGENLIRIGVIGAGGNTCDKHIPGLKAQPDVDIVAVANRTLVSSQRVADELDIPNAVEDWRNIIEDPDIDAVCIGTWPNMHAPLTIAALTAGKHVLCEARMAMNAAEGRRMLRASKRRPRQVAQIVPAPHTLAFDTTIRDMIGDGYIGELITLDARIFANSAFANPDSPPHWRHDRDLSGNNIMAMGIWYEAIMRWLGPADSVRAVAQTVVRHRRNDAGHRVAMTIPDHVDIIGTMVQGGQMRFAISTVVGHAPLPADVLIFGTEGTLQLCLDSSGQMSLRAGRRSDPGLADVAIDPAKQGGWRVEEEFINAIRGLEPVTHTDFATAVKYMEWTDAVGKSMRTGDTVYLPPSGH